VGALEETAMESTSSTSTDFEYRYHVTRNGEPVGTVEAEFHGRAIWEIHDQAFVDPGEPRTMERLDAAVYAAGLEVQPDE
jgi:hypothetical protein